MIESKTITTCPRHPKVETGLACASCGTLICPQCLVQTPVGAKCKDCASQKGNKLFALTPLQTVLAIAVGLLTGAAAGWAVDLGGLGFFTLFLAFAYGRFAGEMILRAAGRKRGVKMEVIVGLSMAHGAIGGRLLIAAFTLSSPGGGHPPYGVLSVIYDLMVPSPIPIAALAIAIASAVSRIRYI